MVEESQEITDLMAEVLKGSEQFDDVREAKARGMKRDSDDAQSLSLEVTWRALMLGGSRWHGTRRFGGAWNQQVAVDSFLLVMCEPFALCLCVRLCVCARGSMGQWGTP